MTPQRYQQVKRVFVEACRLEAADVAAYLDQACAGDDELRAEVEALLANDERTPPIGPRISAAAAMGLDAAERETPKSGLAAEVVTEPEAVPDRIGRYRIVRKIGEGGMGVVYEAEQENPRRTVALKVIRPGVASRQLLGRFRFEAQVLGRLHHPGIAQIYEAGTAVIPGADRWQGEHPYLVMEYIRGRPLNEFVESSGLRTRERLELVAKTCDAVHHAHQKGVIHRDLKPANILVTEDGQPKVLDFGVARLTDSDVQMTTLRTDVGQLIGTISYMSPEQVAGDSQELDTLSDVYALGVICYQTLTGRLPRDILDDAAERAGQDFADQPDVELEVRLFIGEAYRNLSLYDIPWRRWPTWRRFWWNKAS